MSEGKLEGVKRTILQNIEAFIPVAEHLDRLEESHSPLPGR